MMKLSLAPNWWPLDRTTQQDRLEAVLQSPVQRVYLGESVCSKRDRLALRTLLDWGQRFTDQGKEVVLTSLTLLANDKDLALLEQLCSQDQFAIEAHELGSVAAAHQAGLPFVAGAGLNVYNLDTLQWLVELGMTTYQPPLDLGLDGLTAMMTQAENAGLRDKFQLEVLGYGHPPMAVSARCSSARAVGRNRDRCDKVCQQQGHRQADSLEGESLMWLNGLQVHDVTPVDLLGDLARLQALGVDWLRIDPGPEGRLDWLAGLADVLQGGSGQYQAPRPGSNHLWLRQQRSMALCND